MKTKLTVRLDQELINKAKAYAKASGKSVSQMIADYFALLGEPTESSNQKITPVVRSLRGALRGGKVDLDDYHRHLEDKYL